MLLLALLACAPTPPSQLPPPLPLEVSGINPGLPLTLRSESQPGTRIWFARGLAGGQTCPGGPGDPCLDLGGAIALGTAVADAQGTATLTLTPPVSVPCDIEVALQAVDLASFQRSEVRTRVTCTPTCDLSPPLPMLPPPTRDNTCGLYTCPEHMRCLDGLACVDRSPVLGAVSRPVDFDGDGDTDRVLFRQRTLQGAWGTGGRWAIQGMGPSVHDLGDVALGDQPVAGDYDGDGVAEPAVYRASTGAYMFLSHDVQVGVGPWDIPVPADYDGDGILEMAVYSPGDDRLGPNGAWYVLTSTGTLLHDGTAWGTPALSDVPVPADYDGDGRADIAVYRPGSNLWLVAGAATVAFGDWPDDIPVPGDFDGDGRADRAVVSMHDANGQRDGQLHWRFESGAVQVLGANGDLPVPGDYDGDGAIEPTVYRPSTGEWIGLVTQNWGTYPDDLPASVGFARDRARQPRLRDVQQLTSCVEHVAFTSLERIDGTWHLAARVGDNHYSFDGDMQLWTSADGSSWTPSTRLTVSGADMRDPGLVPGPINADMSHVIWDARRLRGVGNVTEAWTSINGIDWVPRGHVGDLHQWLWHPTSHAGALYAMAYTGPSIGEPLEFCRSLDGLEVDCCPVYGPTERAALEADGYPSETGLVMLSDGRMVAVVRRDVSSARPVALLGVSEPPYADWDWRQLDRYIGSPELSVIDDRILVSGRFYNSTQVRTSLAWVDLDDATVDEVLVLELHPLSPGWPAWDQAYADVELHGDDALVSWYATDAAGCTDLFVGTLELP